MTGIDIKTANWSTTMCLDKVKPYEKLADL